MLLGIIKTSTIDNHYYTCNFITILVMWFINLKNNNKERILFSDYIRNLKESLTMTNYVNVFKQRLGYYMTIYVTDL